MFKDSEIEKILYTKREWPQWVHEIFPAVFLYYKKSKPKERKKGGGGFMPVSIIKEPGGQIKYRFKEVKTIYMKMKTRRQNYFSYISVVLQSPDGMGTVKRSLKQKGYTRLIAVFYATDQEVNSIIDCWRYHYLKFRTIKDFFMSRPIDDPRFKTICDELAIRFPSSASQLDLFDEE